MRLVRAYAYKQYTMGMQKKTANSPDDGQFLAHGCEDLTLIGNGTVWGCKGYVLFFTPHLDSPVNIHSFRYGATR